MSLKWEPGFGISFINPNGGKTPIINNNNKLNPELLSTFEKIQITGDDVISSGSLKKFLEKQTTPGFYYFSETEKNKAKQGDVGLYLIFNDKSILKLGNDFL